IDSIYTSSTEVSSLSLHDALPICRILRDSLGKTGRRLTSDPIRTSLGLLPSGPDPVGEWLVHRQSPGPYLGPKGGESKRAGRGFAGLVQEHGKALVARHGRA